MKALMALDQVGATIAHAVVPRANSVTSRPTPESLPTNRRTVLQFSTEKTQKPKSPLLAKVSDYVRQLLQAKALTPRPPSNEKIDLHDDTYIEYQEGDLIQILAAHSQILTEDDFSLIETPFASGIKAVIIRELLCHANPEVRKAAEILLCFYPPLNELNRQSINRLAHGPNLYGAHHQEDIQKAALRIWNRTPKRLPYIRNLGAFLFMLGEIVVENVGDKLKYYTHNQNLK